MKTDYQLQASAEVNGGSRSLKRGVWHQPTQDGIAAFHEHLDVCARCRNRPLDLCEEGKRRLYKAALG